MKKKRILSAALALLLMASLPVTAFAAEWDIANGDITVNAGSDGQTVTQRTNVDIPDSAPVITGSSTTNTVTINADAGQTANVTLKEVNIDVSGTGTPGAAPGSAAVSTSGAGNVTIELDGENTVRSGNAHAGLEKKNDGELTITDADHDGSLNANGGHSGAGIGGGNEDSGSNITITGGEVTANGGKYGAGIGGGHQGSGSDIAITGGTTEAAGGDGSAGIGGGSFGSGSDITVSDDAQVKVQGGGKGHLNGYDVKPGAPIGNGGEFAGEGAEVAPDVSKLTPKGKIEYYAPPAWI